MVSEYHGGNEYSFYNNCYFSLKTLEKSSHLCPWLMSHLTDLETPKAVNYFVTGETLKLMKINSKKYLIVAIAKYVYIYYIISNREFLLINRTSIKGIQFIHCLSLLREGILLIGSRIGIIFFVKNYNLLETFQKENINKEKLKRLSIELKDYEKTYIKDLIELKNGKLICIRGKKDNNIRDRITLISICK